LFVCLFVYVFIYLLKTVKKQSGEKVVICDRAMPKVICF